MIPCFRLSGLAKPLVPQALLYRIPGKAEDLTDDVWDYIFLNGSAHSSKESKVSEDFLGPRIEAHYCREATFSPCVPESNLKQYVLIKGLVVRW